MAKSTMTLGKKIALGYGAILFLLLVSALVSIFSLRSALNSQNVLIEISAKDLVNAQRLNILLLERVSNIRALIMTGDLNYLTSINNAVFEYQDLINQMILSAKKVQDQKLLEKIRRISNRYAVATNVVIDKIKTKAPLAEILKLFKQELLPLYNLAKKRTLDYSQAQEVDLKNLKLQSTDRADFAIKIVSLVSLFALILGILLSLFLVRLLVRQFELATYVANSIAQGARNGIDFPPASDDEIGKLIVAMNSMLNAISAGEKIILGQGQRQSVANQVYALMRGEQTPYELGSKVLSFLAGTFNAQLAIFYRFNGKDKCFPLAQYGLKESDLEQVPALQRGEGLVGEVMRSKRPLLLGDIPAEYTSVISSSLGSATPRYLLLIPIVNDGNLTGIFEFGSFYKFEDECLELFTLIGESVGMGVIVSESREKLRILLKETLSQSEELQVQQEELKNANEELQTQQEELRQTNEVLAAQRAVLEEQKENLEEQNKVIEMARQEVEEKAKAVEQASAFKSEFLANMSHELRTPLNSILILSKNLAENQEHNLYKDQLEYASTIYEAGVDLLNLINDILDLSKIEAGKLEIAVEDLEINDLIISLEKMFKHQMEAKGLYLQFHIAPHTPLTLLTDQFRLEQILKNFLSNALKFTERGGIRVNFTPLPPQPQHISSDPPLMIAISVSDTGIGIPLRKKEIIFEAFAQVDSSLSRKYGGTGLGLSIAKNLARLLGGRIELESREGQGSVFTLFLPEKLILKEVPNQFPTLEHIITPPFKALVPERRGAHGVEDSRFDLRPQDKIILIIEDDPYFAKILWKICCDRKFKTLLASNGEDGILDTLKYKPSGIILDLRLPGVSGIEVLGTLKKNLLTRHIPIHIISVEEKEREVLLMGAVGFLTKPTSKEAIEEALAKISVKIDSCAKNVLVVEDRKVERESILKLIGQGNVAVDAVGTGGEALEKLRIKNYDCMIMDLNLPDFSGLDLLDKMQSDQILSRPPVVVYTGKDLSKEELCSLQKFSESIIIKGARSQERLYDEVGLFLHRVVADLPLDKQQLLERIQHREQVFEGKKLMIVDDDMRNVFALRSVLIKKGFEILVAKTGVEALEKITSHSDISLILMDIMMPEMDGYQAIKQIRLQESHKKLPIIALTAKAMAADREKCLQLGASDYLPKPIDTDKLLSLLRVWLSS